MNINAKVYMTYLGKTRLKIRFKSLVLLLPEEAHVLASIGEYVHAPSQTHLQFEDLHLQVFPQDSHHIGPISVKDG